MSEDNAYKDGDIVWVKLGNNWWPGEVIGSEERLPDGLNQLKRKPFCVVKFFQEEAYEYPRNAKQVHPFQCPKKEEFIKKGLALYNAKNAFMEKFPEDVKYAESLTKPKPAANTIPFINDRSGSIVKAVLSDGRLRKSTDYYESGQADISSGRNSREQSILRRDSATNIMNISTPNRLSIGSAISISTPVSISRTLSTPSSAFASGSSASCLYRCNMCDFSTMRQNVLIMHRKSHSSSGSSGGIGQARSSLSLVKTQSNNSPKQTETEVDGADINERRLSAISIKSTKNAKSPITKKVMSSETVETKVEVESKVNEESNAELLTPKRNRKKLSTSPSNALKRTTRSTPQDLTPSSVEVVEAPKHSNVPDKTNDVHNDKSKPINKPLKHTEKIRDRLLADWSDEEKDDMENLKSTTLDTKATKSPEKIVHQESIEPLQLPTTSAKSHAKRRTPTIVPMTALEGAGQTLIVGAVTPSSETVSKPAQRIRNIPKKDRLREFEKSINMETEIGTETKVTETPKPVVVAIDNASDAKTSVTVTSPSLSKSPGKQKTRVHSKADESSKETEEPSATGATLSCFDFQDEEEEPENDVLKSIAKFKKKYYSPEKEKKEKDENEQKSISTQRDMELSAEIQSLLESTTAVETELKGDTVQVKGLPIKERGKRIFKSRNRSRLEDEESTPQLAQKNEQEQINPETTTLEETSPKVERKLRGRNTPQAVTSPVNGKTVETDTHKPQDEVNAESPVTVPQRRTRKTYNNRIMQQLVEADDASIPFIRHSPVELYNCDVAADASATLVRERGRRSKTATPNSLNTARDEIVNGGSNGGNGASGGCSRASSRNLNTQPLTPTDETSSFGISEAGAEFGSPASSLDEERLLTPRDTPTAIESGNEAELSSEKNLESILADDVDDDDEIESPQHEALSGDESAKPTEMKRSPKKQLEAKKLKVNETKQNAKTSTNADKKQKTKPADIIEVSATNSPKRLTRHNRLDASDCESQSANNATEPNVSGINGKEKIEGNDVKIDTTTLKTQKDENETPAEIVKQSTHRKTRGTISPLQKSNTTMESASEIESQKADKIETGAVANAEAECGDKNEVQNVEEKEIIAQETTVMQKLREASEQIFPTDKIKNLQSEQKQTTTAVLEDDVQKKNLIIEKIEIINKIEASKKKDKQQASPIDISKSIAENSLNNEKQIEITTPSRKRRVADVECKITSPNQKINYEESTESRPSQVVRTPSPKKQKTNISEKPLDSPNDLGNALQQATTTAASNTSQTAAHKKMRIDVDVAHPLSTKIASILAASGSQQHSSAASKSNQSSKHAAGASLKRKLSHEFLSQSAIDGNNDAVVAHVQSLCPQVKITRKERLIEPIVDTSIPEKLLATPKKSTSPKINKNKTPDISQMPILLTTTSQESPPSLVSSNLWQTELIQPVSETMQQNLSNKKTGQKHVVLSSPPEQTNQTSSPHNNTSNSPNGNGSLLQKSPAGVTGGRKNAGNILPIPVKAQQQQQQHKFAEALALADSFFAGASTKPTKRRSSQQTVSSCSTTPTTTNRRFSSAAAANEAKTTTPSPKVPKLLNNEERSKSNSPTKMQSGSANNNSSTSKTWSKTQRQIQHTKKLLETQTLEETTPTVTSTTTSTTATEDSQTVVDAEQLNSTTKITAVPIQPIPGYAETFMLCMLVDDVYKPINNVPHYLNKDLNQLVPVPPEAYEGILPEFAVEQPLAADNLNAASTTTTSSSKLTSIVSTREGGETLIESGDDTDARIADIQLDESVLVGNADVASLALESDSVETTTDNAIVLNLENQQIILDASSFEQLLANPDANTQLLLEDGTEFVLTREVLAALKAQHDDQANELLAIPAEQQQQEQLIASEAGTSADLLSVALANSEYFGGEMLQIETTLGGIAGTVGGVSDAAGLQLLASDGSIVFQAPPLPQAHLTPPITAHTSETNAVLNQTPIMSTLEKPSTAASCLESPTAAAAVTAVVEGGDLLYARPNLDDSLAVIGVSTQSSTVPSSLELPITITNPAIAPRVTLAGAHTAAAAAAAGGQHDIVQFQPGRSVATAAVGTNVSHIYDDSIDSLN